MGGDTRRRPPAYEYRGKVADAGKHYKLLIAPEGKLRMTYREVPSEIELPLK